ncbi:hypothetical protein HMPREF9144_1762 [Prevotella pallens ATCC 700821]|uniref:Uncharacterized protein n=1 Tax=Prevotella pallens ATCC 700821 TaxID=997353 RepID=F9DJC2_9BACT|nr:hypothetical protein HMPREF9144_1762 [Prevotella pallens ATCC 700821]
MPIVISLQMQCINFCNITLYYSCYDSHQWRQCVDALIPY